MRMDKETYKLFHKAFIKLYKEENSLEINICSEHNTVSEGIEIANERMNKAFDRLGKFIEEMEDLGFIK